MANFNFTQVVIGGRLTADPELKTTPSGISCVTFTIAVNQHKEESEFYRVTAWRQTAEFIAKYFRKSYSICVSGKLHVNKWTAKDGTERQSVEITAYEAFFVDSRNELPAQAEPQAQQTQQTYQQPQVYQPHLEDLPDDEDLPF